MLTNVIIQKADSGVFGVHKKGDSKPNEIHRATVKTADINSTERLLLLWVFLCK